jgi:hypothetical protein
MPGKDLVPVPSPTGKRNGGNGGWPYAGPGAYSTYTEEVGAEICRRLVTGEPMAWITRDDHMPNARTVYAWLQVNPKFAAEVEISNRLGHDARAAWALEESLYPREAEERTVRHSAKGAEVTIRKFDNVNRSRLVVDTTMKLLGQWDARYRRQAEQEALENERRGGVEERIKVEGGLPDVEQTGSHINGKSVPDDRFGGIEDPTNGETP